MYWLVGYSESYASDIIKKVKRAFLKLNFGNFVKVGWKNLL